MVIALKFDWFFKNAVLIVIASSKARFKRRTLHLPNLMQMSENNRFFSFALGSAHVKFDV